MVAPRFLKNWGIGQREKMNFQVSFTQGSHLYE